MSRWNSWGAASPLWVPGLVLIGLGAALIYGALRSVRHG
jgi:hypothetical protein